jgi:phage tail-like protein
MAEIEDGTKSFYAVYDGFYKKGQMKNALANFDSLTGGDQKIAMIPFTQVFADGSSTTKYIPGQISFEPITLLRGFDVQVEDLYNWFADTAAGKFNAVKKNISIAMIDMTGDPLVVWNLENALPTAISGFSFNQHAEAYYTDFELTLQAELITMPPLS